MPLLLLVSFIWAFSPGLTKGLLIGLDSGFTAATRVGLACLVFLPFLRLRGVTVRTGFALAGIGAVQFGLMYLAYNEALRHLQSYEVALFTLTTPILVTLLADAFDGTLRMRALLASLLAVVGAGVVTVRNIAIDSTVIGIVLVQLSNAAFALGQVCYRRVRTQNPELVDQQVFALLYAGAFAVTVPFALAHLDFATFALNPRQTRTLLYLGVIASGLAFFLWNVGATRVASGTLAVMNNAKIPLMVACSLLIFGESANVPRLFLGGGLMALAVWLAGAQRRIPNPCPQAD